MPKIAETRGATSADFEFAWNLYAKTVRPLIEPHIMSERNEPWIEGNEQTRFSAIWDPARAMVITCEGSPIGWLSVAESDDAVLLENFYIEVDFRNQGLGTAILEWLCGRHKKRPITTTIITGSPSRSLYERAGFVETQRVGFQTVMQLT